MMNISQKKSSMYFVLVLISLVFIGIYIFNSSRSLFLSSNSTKVSTTTPNNSQGGVSAVENKTTTQFQKTVPPGFPSDILVDPMRITLSNKTVFAGRNTSQYTVSYTSNLSRDALLKLYTESLTSAGYVINKDTDKAISAAVPLNAVKRKNILFVTVLNSGKESLVQLNLLIRP